MAYTRFNPDEDRGFNGIDKVRKNLNENPRQMLSNDSVHEILSNQRAYGIWGKYNRPFQDIGMTKDERFKELFSGKINSLPNTEDFVKYFQKVLTRDTISCDENDRELCRPLLKLNKSLKEFYVEYLLKVKAANPYQNLLFDYFSKVGVPDNFDLYDILKKFRKFIKGNQSVEKIIDETISIDKIISPLARIFRYLHNKPIWTKKELERDDFLDQCKIQTQYVFNGIDDDSILKNSLQNTLNKANWLLVQDLVKRNAEITDLRGGSAWMGIKGDLLEVFYSDGGNHDEDYNPELNNSNNYFIDTYLKIFEKIID